MNAPFRLSIICYPYHSSKHTGRGHDRYIADLIENASAERKDIAIDAVDTGFAKNTLHGVLKLPRQAAAILRTQADVYHAVTPMGGAAAAVLGKTPLVVTIHDLVPFQIVDYDGALKNRIIRQSVRICLKFAKAIIVPYQVTKGELVSRLSADPTKIHVVNYGVDHQTYAPRRDIERAPRTILFVGAVSRAKGVDVLIRAFAQVKAQVPDAKLVIGGKSTVEQPILEDLVQRLGVEDLTFAGFIAESALAEQYARATVMVFPSHYGFGLSTLEAMACGAPVVGVSTLDAPEFFADAGLLAKPDDAADLARCLISVLTQPDLQQELSRKSLARAAHFSWARMARETVGVYEQVL